MRGNKCICAVLAGMLLCLLSACTISENGKDMEPQESNDLVQHESGSETLPSEIDSAGQQVTESTRNEQSSDTASMQDENMTSEMEELYKAILFGEEDFVRIDYRGEDKSLNIKDIKKVVSDEDWVTAEVTKFTIIDLDGNGEDELVLWIERNGDSVYGYEILFYQDQEVYGFTLPDRGFMNLKTDGTFETFGGIENSDDYFGVGRLQLSEKGYTIEDASDSGSQESKTDVGWYELTPESVELAFENKF